MIVMNYVFRFRGGSLLGHITLLLFGLCCSTNSRAAGEKIGVLMKDRTTAYWLYVEKGASAAGKDLHVDVIVKGGPNTYSPAVQAKLLESLAGENLSALVISPLNPEQISGAVQTLVTKGVKIVTLDTPLPNIPSMHLSPDQGAMGEAAAAYMAKLASETDEVALIRNNGVDLSVLARENKAASALRAAHPQMIIWDEIYSSSGAAAAIDQARYLLEKHPHVKAVFASSPTSTEAIMQAIAEAKLVGSVKVIGFGTFPSPEIETSIRRGELAACLAQRPENLGRTGVEVAVNLIRGDGPPVRPIINFLLLTQENIDSPEARAMCRPME